MLFYFELAPETNGYKLSYSFDTNDAFAKTLDTQETSLEGSSNGVSLRVINNVNAERTGFRFLSESQIDKLISRGGY